MLLGTRPTSITFGTLLSNVYSKLPIVATSKKAISAYLSSELEEYLTKYCTEYSIIRKDKSGEIKPALGTAVVEILRIFFSDENVPSPLPDNVPLLPSNVVTKNDLDKRVEAVINEAIPRAIAVLKNDEDFLKTIALIVVQKLSTVATDQENYSSENAIEQAETEEDEDETITQIDKASLTPIFEDEDEDEEVDFQSCTVSHLRKIVTIKGLGKKFREKLGKYPGNAKKAEIVKFLNETSIFDYD